MFDVAPTYLAFDEYIGLSTSTFVSERLLTSYLSTPSCFADNDTFFITYFENY